MEGKSIPCNCLYFWTLMKDDDFSKEILIPHSFVMNHAGKIFRRCVLVDFQTNISWNIKIRHRGWGNHHYYYLCEGEWCKFVKFYGLKHGDGLVFLLVDQGIFKVIYLGSNGSGNIPVFYGIDASSDGSPDYDDEDDDEHSSRESSEEDGKANKKRRVDSRVNHSQHRSHANKKLMVEPTTGPSNRSKNFKKPTVELSLPGPSNRWKNAIACASRKSDTNMDLEAEDPFCIVIMKQHNNSYMTIPRQFARVTKIEEKKNIILRSKDKGEWEVKIIRTVDRVNMAKGWTDFYKGHGLKEGDTCKFTHLRDSENELLVEITNA